MWGRLFSAISPKTASAPIAGFQPNNDKSRSLRYWVPVNLMENSWAERRETSTASCHGESWYCELSPAVSCPGVSVRSLDPCWQQSPWSEPASSMQDNWPHFSELQETSFVMSLPRSINCFGIQCFYFCLTFSELVGEEFIGLAFLSVLAAKPVQIFSGYGSVSLWQPSLLKAELWHLQLLMLDLCDFFQFSSLEGVWFFLLCRWRIETKSQLSHLLGILKEQWGRKVTSLTVSLAKKRLNLGSTVSI